MAQCQSSKRGWIRCSHSSHTPSPSCVYPDQQVSQQFGQLSMQLETTNNSLQEQLHFGTVQLQHMEKDLLDSKEELAQRQKTLEGELKAHQAAHEQLQLCQADREKMQETLQKEEAQKQTMQQMLSHMQDTLRPFFTCPSQGTCSGHGGAGGAG